MTQEHAREAEADAEGEAEVDAEAGAGESRPVAAAAASDLPEARYRAGSGEPMVLVHGIGGTWLNFKPLLPLLERRHDVLAINLLGHHGGERLPDGTRASVAAFTDGVERELDRGGFQTAHLVGNSLGGWIVLELAKRGRARTVVALSPGGGYRQGSLSSDFTAARLYLENRLATRFLAPRAERLVDTPVKRKLLFGGVVARPERITPEQGVAMLRGFAGAGIFRDTFVSMRRDGPLADAGRITAPVLIAWGTKDRVLPMRWFAPQLRAAIPAAEFRELPGLGHVPMIDDPELLAELILDFTARHASAGAGEGDALAPRAAYSA